MSKIRSFGSPRRTLHPQKLTHLDPQFATRKHAVRLLLVGAGGTGSKLLDFAPVPSRHLHLARRAGTKRVVKIDGQLVS